jgi:hypothetical protein
MIHSWAGDLAGWPRWESPTDEASAAASHPSLKRRDVSHRTHPIRACPWARSRDGQLRQGSLVHFLAPPLPPEVSKVSKKFRMCALSDAATTPYKGRPLSSRVMYKIGAGVTAKLGESRRPERPKASTRPDLHASLGSPHATASALH